MHYIWEVSRSANIVWNIFSNDIYGKIISIIFFICFCWSVNYMSLVSKFHIFWHAQKLEKKNLRAFNIVIYGKFNFNFPAYFKIVQVTFLAFFCWSVNCLSIWDNNLYLRPFSIAIYGKLLKIFFLYILEARNLALRWKIVQNLIFVYLFSPETAHPAGNYMFKVNNRNTRTRCEICSKLTIHILFWWLYC